LDKGLKLLVRTSQEVSGCLIGDPHRLNQIIVNLLSNAIKFSEHGEVSLETGLLEKESERVHLKFCVRDTGIGLSTEQHKKLFQPFTQADGSTTRRFGGTGLGLSISKQLVELMGGEIWCESVQGEGSSFYLTVWFDNCKESDLEQCSHVCTSNSGDKEPSFNFSGSSILLVEDNEINRQLGIELLKDTGALVHLAENGKEAVTMITDGSTAYDLVLMDIQMPVMGGFEATRLIRSDRRFAALPIIAMTAHALQEELHKILQAGMDAYITKPIDAKAMLRTMSVFLCGQGSSVHIFENRENTTGNEAVIPDIEGLDVSGALYRLDGDRDLYLWLLRSFVENQTGIAPLIEELLSADDTGQAARHIHTIKGIAGSMGAVALEDLSRSLENAIAKGEPFASISESLRCFTSELERLTTLLKSNLPVDPETGGDALPGSVDVPLLTTILNRLQDHIRARDGKAERYLESFQRELSSLPDKEVGQLKKLLGNFDFEAAHESLLTLASRSGITLTT
jgi:CheY-like chemotaxis protein